MPSSFLFSGLVISEEASSRPSNFLNRKTNRNYRTKAPQRTTAAPASEDDDDEETEVRTSAQCPQPDVYISRKRLNKTHSNFYYCLMIFLNCFSRASSPTQTNVINIMLAREFYIETGLANKIFEIFFFLCFRQ